jgi:anti-anti-sigma factor
MEWTSRACALPLKGTMLKIIPVDGGASGDVLKLEGKVAGAWVPALHAACVDVLDRRGGRLTLDLRDVSFIDASGLALIRNLVGLDVTLANCSAFTAEQLRAIARREGSVHER